MTTEEIIKGLKCIRARADVSGDVEFWETANEAIKALEQTRWTPVSEGLPKANGRYWISTKTIVCEDNFENDEFVFYRSNVLAWMPLPQPYKAESEEE